MRTLIPPAITHAEIFAVGGFGYWDVFRGGLRDCIGGLPGAFFD